MHCSMSWVLANTKFTITELFWVESFEIVYYASLLTLSVPLEWKSIYLIISSLIEAKSLDFCAFSNKYNTNLYKF